MDSTNLEIPFTDSIAAWIKQSCGRNSPDQMAMIILIAELTNSGPDAVLNRFNELRTECSRVYYGL